jgi:hypothetical protein
MKRQQLVESETMPKQSIGSALSSSLRAEQKAVEQRFDGLSNRAARADQVLGKTADVSLEQRKEGTEQTHLPQKLDVPTTPIDREGEYESSVQQGNVVRANFSMPISDYDLITQLREKFSRNGVILSRSEILRAGLRALFGMPIPQQIDIAGSIEHLKPGPIKRGRRSE